MTKQMRTAEFWILIYAALAAASFLAMKTTTPDVLTAVLFLLSLGPTFVALPLVAFVFSATDGPAWLRMATDTVAVGLAAVLLGYGVKVALAYLFGLGVSGVRLPDYENPEPIKTRRTVAQRLGLPWRR